MNPWWGNPYSESSLFAKDAFDAYSFDISYYSVTADLGAADLVFVPYRHVWMMNNDKALLEAGAQAARRAGLPLLIDGVGDVEYPIGIENCYVLRIGGYRFMREQGRIQLPSVSDDLLERCAGGVLEVRSKKTGQKPVVGFAGWASLTPTQILRTVVKELPVRVRGVFDSRYRACTKGVLWRARAIALLKRSPKVTLNLKERSAFSGSQKTAGGNLRRLRQELVDTIQGSDYCLDVRGDANESTRLYEILSLGRIPVILDTERNLPFCDVVDYNSFALIVDFRDIDTIADRIAEFHAAVSPERFEEMQRNARNAFVKHFRIDAVMPHIVRQLSKML
jgi:glycosyltransferase involved in cell wall biosynthesis